MIKIENILIAIFGLVSVIFFVIMVVSGGLFRSVYTLLFQEVSFIISPYSGVSEFTFNLYKLYNFYLILFASVLGIRIKSKFARFGTLYLIISGIFGLVLLEFPMDPNGVSNTQQGILHIAVALIMSFYTSVALLLFAYCFKRSAHLRWLTNYSTLTSLTIMITGFIVGIFAYKGIPDYVGFMQKLPILSFLSWIAITAVAMLYSDHRIKYFVWH